MGRLRRHALPARALAVLAVTRAGKSRPQLCGHHRPLRRGGTVQAAAPGPSQRPRGLGAGALVQPTWAEAMLTPAQPHPGRPKRGGAGGRPQHGLRAPALCAGCGWPPCSALASHRLLWGPRLRTEDRPSGGQPPLQQTQKRHAGQTLRPGESLHRTPPAPCPQGATWPRDRVPQQMPRHVSRPTPSLQVVQGLQCPPSGPCPQSSPAQGRGPWGRGAAAPAGDFLPT